MNAVRLVTTTLVGIVTTCVLSAGAASAQVAPNEAAVSSTNSPSLVASEQAAPAEARAQHVAQKAAIAHMERVFADQAAVKQGGSVANQGPVSHAKPGTRSRVTPNTPSPHSGNGTEIAVVALTALAGLALGAAGSAGSRRLRHRSGLTA